MNDSHERRARFEALFHSHCGEVRAYALRRTSPAAAEDAVAETFLVAWRRLDWIGEDPLPWLLGVARRVLANQFRSDRRRLALRERLHGDRSVTPALPVPAAMREDLGEALVALSPREREALLLVAWEGLSPERAARAAGCSAATFRVRLHRARRHVAAALDGRPDPSPARSLEETR